MKSIMNKKFFRITILIIGTGIAATGIIFFSGEPAEKSGTEQPGQQKQPTQVRVITVEMSKISETLELTGSVEPYRVARLASPAEGPVVDVRVREADRVTTGEPLLSIGRRAGVNALIVSLREELKKEEDNLSRTQQLVESQALPGEQLDQARAAYEKVRASLIKAEETARDYIIKAPWAGVVSRINVKEGEFVAPRAVLLEMYDPASLVIRASIPEKHAAEVTTGMRVDVSLDAYPDNIIPGMIERIYPYLDSRLRTRNVEIALDKSVNLLPGMFARLTLSLKNAEDVVVVPLEALVGTPKGRVVFLFEDGKATSRMVETGIEADNQIEIISGIRVGDKVIVAGNEKLKNGADVRIAEAGKPGMVSNNTSPETSAGKPGKTGDDQ